MYVLLIEPKTGEVVRRFDLHDDFTLILSQEPQSSPDDLLRVVAHVGLTPTFDRVSVSVHDGAEGVDVYDCDGKLVGLIHADGLEKL